MLEEPETFSEISPGEWEATNDDRHCNQNRKPAENELEQQNEEFLQQMRYDRDSEKLLLFSKLFQDAFGTPRRVYYPASGHDTVPLFIFPNSEIIFLDIAQENITLLRNNISDRRVQFVRMCAKDYEPEEKFDLVYISRSHAKWPIEIKDLKTRGHLVTSQEWIDHGFNHPDLRLVGVTENTYGKSHGNVISVKLVVSDLKKYEKQSLINNSILHRHKLREDYYVFQKLR